MDGGSPHDALARRVADRTLSPPAAPQPPPRASALGRLAAYAALGLTLVALPLIDRSEADCEFDPEAQDHVGTLGAPGATAGPLAFLLGPLLAGAALVVLLPRDRETGERPRARLAVTAAFVAYALAGLDFVLYLAKSAFACGFF